MLCRFLANLVTHLDAQSKVDFRALCATTFVSARTTTKFAPCVSCRIYKEALTLVKRHARFLLEFCLLPGLPFTFD
eukprot:m.336763 g.336763  ORF g.336763 m.336763 type:complete len:76 (+) comp16529_c1_seq1:996-1223(+)